MQKIFANVQHYIDQAVRSGDLPGAALAVVKPGSEPFLHVAGYAHKDKQIRVEENTLFDLASLTKVTATLPAILRLLELGQIDLDDPIYRYVPAFEEHNHDLTIKHLLTHTSGYQPEIKFHERNLSLEEAVNEIAFITAKKVAGREVIYSDLNYITLGYLCEQVSGMSLNDFAVREIYRPLGMKNTFFNPQNSEKERTAATEFRNELNDFQWGSVHDENADNFGGISGHAGLFSTAGDLVNFCEMLLNAGSYRGTKVLSALTVKLAGTCLTPDSNLKRGLGWQLYSPGVFSGQFLQDGYGHTGFTGTSIWMSPEKNFAVVLLTNRVHYGRETDISSFRRAVHNLVAIAMEEATVTQE